MVLKLYPTDDVNHAPRETEGPPKPGIRPSVKKGTVAALSKIFSKPKQVARASKSTARSRRRNSGLLTYLSAVNSGSKMKTSVNRIKRTPKRLTNKRLDPWRASGRPGRSGSMAEKVGLIETLLKPVDRSNVGVYKKKASARLSPALSKSETGSTSKEEDMVVKSRPSPVGSSKSQPEVNLEADTQVNETRIRHHREYASGSRNSFFSGTQMLDGGQPAPWIIGSSSSQQNRKQNVRARVLAKAYARTKDNRRAEQESPIINGNRTVSVWPSMFRPVSLLGNLGRAGTLPPDTLALGDHLDASEADFTNYSVGEADNHIAQEAVQLWDISLRDDDEVVSQETLHNEDGNKTTDHVAAVPRLDLSQCGNDDVIGPVASPTEEDPQPLEQLQCPMVPPHGKNDVVEPVAQRTDDADEPEQLQRPMVPTHGNKDVVEPVAQRTVEDAAEEPEQLQRAMVPRLDQIDPDKDESDGLVCSTPSSTDFDLNAADSTLPGPSAMKDALDKKEIEEAMSELELTVVRDADESSNSIECEDIEEKELAQVEDISSPVYLPEASHDFEQNNNDEDAQRNISEDLNGETTESDQHKSDLIFVDDHFEELHGDTEPNEMYSPGDLYYPDEFFSSKYWPDLLLSPISESSEEELTASDGFYMTRKSSADSKRGSTEVVETASEELNAESTESNLRIRDLSFAEVDDVHERSENIMMHSLENQNSSNRPYSPVDSFLPGEIFSSECMYWPGSLLSPVSERSEEDITDIFQEKSKSPVGLNEKNGVESDSADVDIEDEITKCIFQEYETTKSPVNDTSDVESDNADNDIGNISRDGVDGYKSEIVSARIASEPISIPNSYVHTHLPGSSFDDDASENVITPDPYHLDIHADLSDTEIKAVKHNQEDTVEIEGSTHKLVVQFDTTDIEPDDDDSHNTDQELANNDTLESKTEESTLFPELSDPLSPELDMSGIPNTQLDMSDILNQELNMTDIPNPELEMSDIPNPELEMSDIPNSELNMSDIPNPELEMSDIANPELDMSDIPNQELNMSDIPNPKLEMSDIPNPELEMSDIPNSELKMSDIQYSDEQPVQSDITALSEIFNLKQVSMPDLVQSTMHDLELINFDILNLKELLESDKIDPEMIRPDISKLELVMSDILKLVELLESDKILSLSKANTLVPEIKANICDLDVNSSTLEAETTIVQNMPMVKKPENVTLTNRNLLKAIQEFQTNKLKPVTQPNQKTNPFIPVKQRLPTMFPKFAYPTRNTSWYIPSPIRTEYPNYLRNSWLRLRVRNGSDAKCKSNQLLPIYDPKPVAQNSYGFKAPTPESLVELAFGCCPCNESCVCKSQSDTTTVLFDSENTAVCNKKALNGELGEESKDTLNEAADISTVGEVLDKGKVDPNETLDAKAVTDGEALKNKEDNNNNNRIVTNNKKHVNGGKAETMKTGQSEGEINMKISEFDDTKQVTRCSDDAEQGISDIGVAVKPDAKEKIDELDGIYYGMKAWNKAVKLDGDTKSCTLYFEDAVSKLIREKYHIAEESAGSDVKLETDQHDDQTNEITESKKSTNIKENHDRNKSKMSEKKPMSFRQICDWLKRE